MTKKNPTNSNQYFLALLFIVFQFMSFLSFHLDFLRFFFLAEPETPLILSNTISLFSCPVHHSFPILTFFLAKLETPSVIISSSPSHYILSLNLFFCPVSNLLSPTQNSKWRPAFLLTHADYLHLLSTEQNFEWKSHQRTSQPSEFVIPPMNEIRSNLDRSSASATITLDPTTLRQWVTAMFWMIHFDLERG
jgi:hypothetical protein